MRSALWLPVFDELADPRLVVRLAVEAEEAGWDALFIWDHVRWREPVQHVGDATTMCAAVAAVTERLRLGPMVTPLARRRPVKLARESATLDQLSDGRLTLGVGLGSDRFGGEFSLTGEETDDRVRAAMLDEALRILQAAWTGEPVRHVGEHYTVEGIRFLPTPLQRPGPPVWVAGFPGNVRPMRRAARHDGFFPVNLTAADELAEAVEMIVGLRSEAGSTGHFDIAVALPPDGDLAAYSAAGATWWLTDFDSPTPPLDTVRGVLRDGPYSA